MIPAMANIPPQFLQAMGGVGTMAIYMMTRKSRSQQDQDLMEEEGVDVNANL